MCEHCASTDGARRAQNCALYTSVCFVVSVPLFAMCSRLFMLSVKMYAVCRSQLCTVNVREYEVQDTFPLQKHCLYSSEFFSSHRRISMGSGMFHSLGRRASVEVLHDVDKQISTHGTRIFCFASHFVAFCDFNLIFLLEVSLCYR